MFRLRREDDWQKAARLHDEDAAAETAETPALAGEATVPMRVTCEPAPADPPKPTPAVTEDAVRREIRAMRRELVAREWLDEAARSARERRVMFAPGRGWPPPYDGML